MVEAELLIGHLRRQVQDMQHLVNYLESRQSVEADDYTYSHSKLRELVSSLKGLERFSQQRGSIHSLRAGWLN
jgi:hypothetical protein